MDLMEKETVTFCSIIWRNLACNIQSSYVEVCLSYMEDQKSFSLSLSNPVFLTFVCLFKVAQDDNCPFNRLRILFSLK